MKYIFNIIIITIMGTVYLINKIMCIQISNTNGDSAVF